MLQVEMSASVRKDSGKGAMRRLRKAGQTPAVVYGEGVENVALQLETVSFFQQLLKISRTNAVVTLQLDDGGTKTVILKEVQTDPVRDTLVHADFQEIDVNKNRNFEVPISYVGTAKGTDLGGIMNAHLDTVLLDGAPLSIPDQFEIDVTSLNIGDRITVDSLEIPAGVTLVTDSTATCVTVDKPGLVKDDDDGENGEEESAIEAEPAAE
jgi:large subunit ribosomal protein L25